MYRLFCCRSRRTSRVEVDEITDSLEKCLSVERGVSEFRCFLQSHYFEKELVTLDFVLRCQNVLTNISRLSPVTREIGFPDGIQNDIRSLYRMADDINFDLSQMNALSNLDSIDIGRKVRTIEAARIWAIDLLREVYNTFRNNALRRV